MWRVKTTRRGWDVEKCRVYCAKCCTRYHIHLRIFYIFTHTHTHIHTHISKETESQTNIRTSARIAIFVSGL